MPLNDREQDHTTAFFLGGIVAFVVIALLTEICERVAAWIVS